MHASANLYGLGRGIYPFGRSPWPAHPNTLSYQVIVFEDEVTAADREGRESALDWLGAQDAATQVAVLGSRAKRAALVAGVLKAGDIRVPWQDLKPATRGAGWTWRRWPGVVHERGAGTSGAGGARPAAAALRLRVRVVRRAGAAGAGVAGAGRRQRAGQVPLQALGGGAAAVRRAVTTRREKQPRDYAREIAELPTRQARAEALARVPPHWQALVRETVDSAFAVRRGAAPQPHQL